MLGRTGGTSKKILSPPTPRRLPGSCAAAQHCHWAHEPAAIRL